MPGNIIIIECIPYTFQIPKKIWFYNYNLSVMMQLIKISFPPY